MEIKKDYALKKHNTFSIDAKADWFITYDSLEDIFLLCRDEYFQEIKFLHVGEGSNLLFLSNFHGAILKSQIKGIEVIEEKEEEDSLIIEAGSGVVWDDFVDFAVKNGYYGAENLSAIPGEVGAAALQNIGAYGVEISDIIEEVFFVELRSGQEKSLKKEEMKYSYRYSILKDPEYDRIAIYKVRFRLKKRAELKLDYPDLKRYFEGKENPELSDIRRAIIEIRSKKLPETSKIGNAGSYFMNPIIEEEKWQRIKASYPRAPHYRLEDGRVKVPAAWLIDTAGWKGYREGDAGVYPLQALILVNYGGATGRDIVRLAEKIQATIKEKFDIDIYPEVKYIL